VIRIKKIPRWIWPLGIAAAGIGAASTVLLRGCWHRNLSWPKAHGEYAYQVCNDCGIMRLFDENAFRPYGPYGYDLDELVALERTRRMKRAHREHETEGRAKKDEGIVPKARGAAMTGTDEMT
jgi:hypothetical protein